MTEPCKTKRASMKLKKARKLGRKAAAKSRGTEPRFIVVHDDDPCEGSIRDTKHQVPLLRFSLDDADPSWARHGEDQIKKVVDVLNSRPPVITT